MSSDLAYAQEFSRNAVNNASALHQELEQSRSELAAWKDMAFERGLDGAEECAFQLDGDGKQIKSLRDINLDLVDKIARFLVALREDPPAVDEARVILRMAVEIANEAAKGGPSRYSTECSYSLNSESERNVT